MLVKFGILVVVFVSAPLKKPHDPCCSLNERLSNRSVHGDGLSSTQLVTDDTGAQAARIVYGAWGEQLSVNDSVPGGLDVRFVGGLGVRNDSATGLVWMRHRWFDSTLGRFISRDPIGHKAGANLYKYALGNPSRFVDPRGLKPPIGQVMTGLGEIGAGATAIFVDGPAPIGDTVGVPLVIRGATRIGASVGIDLGIVIFIGGDEHHKNPDGTITVIPGPQPTPSPGPTPSPEPKPPIPVPPGPPTAGSGDCWDQYQTAKANLKNAFRNRGSLGYQIGKAHIDELLHKCNTDPCWKQPEKDLYWPSPS